MAPTALHIDPTKNSKLQVHLGEALRNPGGAGNGLTSIRFNHKPNQTSNARSTTINQASASTNSATLTIADSDPPTSHPTTYTYTGRRSSATDSFALIYDPASQSFTLEPIDSSYNFNLSSAPWEEDAAKLRKQYPQLDISSTTENRQADADGDADLFGDAEDDEPDSDNPFDYRHYINGRNLSSSPETPGISRVGTPLINAQRIPAVKASPAMKPRPAMRGGAGNVHRATGAASVSAQQKAKPKPKPTAKIYEPPAKRQRTEAGPSPRTSQQIPHASPPPQIRLERKASIPNTNKISDAELDSDEEDEDEDAGYSGFELDMDPKTGPSTKKGDLEAVVGNLKREFMARGADAFNTGDEADDDEEDDEIDTLDLGSPAVGKPHNAPPTVIAAADDEDAQEPGETGILRRKSTYEFDDAALEKELEQAMGAEADAEGDEEQNFGGGHRGRKDEESEEESEEE